MFAFVLVAVGILVLRHTNPEAPRPFRTPLVPAVPVLGIVSCGYRMFTLPWQTGGRDSGQHQASGIRH